MRDGMGQICAGKIRLQIKNVLSQTCDFVVLSLREIPDEKMNFTAIPWKISGHFLAQKDAGQRGDFQHAVERVVIGERDEIHPAPAQPFVEGARLRIAVGEVESPEEPIGRTVAKTGMQVEVGLHRKAHL